MNPYFTVEWGPAESHPNLGLKVKTRASNVEAEGWCACDPPGSEWTAIMYLIRHGLWPSLWSNNDVAKWTLCPTQGRFGQIAMSSRVAKWRRFGQMTSPRTHWSIPRAEHAKLFVDYILIEHMLCTGVNSDKRSAYALSIFIGG